MYIMTAGAAAVRRLQGGGASAIPGGLPGANAGMAAATRSEGGMFAAKEYSKVRGRLGWAALAPGLGVGMVGLGKECRLCLQMPTHTRRFPDWLSGNDLLPQLSLLAGEPAGEEREEIQGCEGLQ